MSYLIDTNVISELVKPQPNSKVIHWFGQIPSESLFLSVLTLGEIRKGIEKVSDNRRKEKLRLWLEHELQEWFNGRILNIDQKVSDYWGRLLGRAHKSLPSIDSLIAATALQNDLILVTKNVTDFKFFSLEIINPWEF